MTKVSVLMYVKLNHFNPHEREARDLEGQEVSENA